jgi:flagellar basal-body rod protein FlgF
MHIDSLGRLTNGAGNLMLGNNGPISIPPHDRINFGSDGTISVVPLGESAETLAVIDRIKLVNPDIQQMHKGADGLMRLDNGAPAVADAEVSTVSGSLESSNVNTVESMVRMIELARQYEAHIKLMRTAEDNDKAAAQILQMS